MQPHVRKYHCGFETLHLHAWNLSSDSLERLDILRKLRASRRQTFHIALPPFTNLSGRRGVDPCKATIPVFVELFLHLRQDLGFSVTADKGYRAALNHVFTLTGIDLATSCVVSRMFCHFERSCPSREIRPPDWNLSLILRYLSRPPFAPLKLASDKHLT